LRDLAKIPREFGFDFSKPRFSVDATQMLHANRKLIYQMIIGPKRKDDKEYAQYFAKRHFDHIPTVLGSTEIVDDDVSGENPLHIYREIRDKEMPNWRERMAFFGYVLKKNGNPNKDEDYEYVEARDQHSKDFEAKAKKEAENKSDE
jgi:hypothetical protein